MFFHAGAKESSILYLRLNHSHTERCPLDNYRPGSHFYWYTVTYNLTANGRHIDRLPHCGSSWHQQSRVCDGESNVGPVLRFPKVTKEDNGTHYTCAEEGIQPASTIIVSVYGESYPVCSAGVSTVDVIMVIL